MTKCDFCDNPATIDGRMKNRSSWAYFCDDCAAELWDEAAGKRLIVKKETTRVQKISFEQWLKKIDFILWIQVGLSYLDLEDMTYRDYYDDGISAETIAQILIEGIAELDQIIIEDLRGLD